MSKLSKCHNAPTKIDIGRCLNKSICTECNQPCDLADPEPSKAEMNLTRNPYPPTNHQWRYWNEGAEAQLAADQIVMEKRLEEEQANLTEQFADKYEKRLKEQAEEIFRWIMTKSNVQILERLYGNKIQIIMDAKEWNEGQSKYGGLA